MVQLATAASSYFEWQHFHPRESEDPQSLWAAAWQHGAHAALHDSARVVELVPLLTNLLYPLEDGRVEAEGRSIGQPYDEDECEVSW
jgi:hypothetical protein